MKLMEARVVPRRQKPPEKCTSFGISVTVSCEGGDELPPAIPEVQVHLTPQG